MPWGLSSKVGVCSPGKPVTILMYCFSKDSATSSAAASALEDL